MKIAIVGAGVIGVTTAYELAVDGHEVTVFERHRAAAEEASFANAGVIAPGYVAPWAAPGMPAKVFEHLFSRHASVKVKLPLNAAELGWMRRGYRACKLGTYLANRASMQNLAAYSRNRLRSISADLALEYERSDGLLKSIKPLKLSIPLIPVYGYSVSAMVCENLNAPNSALMDERYKVAITRLGNRIRVAGSAEIGGPATGGTTDSKRSTAFDTLYKVLQDWFPGAAHTSQTSSVQERRGARPMLQDGPPIIGPSGTPGIWLNLGHGSSGWALSCGSARAIADLIAQRQPEVDLSRMTIERFYTK